MPIGEEIIGIWKGEYAYADECRPYVVATAIPFILRVKSVNQQGVFEGMNQDDPVISKIRLPATIYGKCKDQELHFVKRFKKTLAYDGMGTLMTGDDEHPDVVYKGTLKENGQFFGTWHVAHTFRKINDAVLEFKTLHGIWWMKRM